MGVSFGQLSNFYCAGMLHFEHNYISLIIVADTNLLNVDYVTAQTRGLSIKISEL